ncbi:Fc receptor-like protein 1 [Rhynchocyon petersi]
MTLTCEVYSIPNTTERQRKLCFFRGSERLGSACSSASELQIRTMWTTDSGSYWCQAESTDGRVTRSKNLQIHVQRIPVSDVRLETQPPGGQVTEGKKLVLVCSVAKGTGDITFFWYKGTMGLELATRTQRSLTAELEILPVKESDAEQYYCAADNGYKPRLSGLVSITVRVPVSRPVLTLRPAGTQVVVGDVVELHCEAQRGSPPIFYTFYHKDIIMGSSWASSRKGASFNISLTEEHSGNYSCEAGNSLGTQSSEAVLLNITVNLVSGNDVYSLVYSIQQEQESAAEPSRTFTEEKVG